jgi:hypothetical protein
MARKLSVCQVQNNEDSALECVPFVISTDPLTRVSEAREGRGSRIPLFSGSGVHQSLAHGVFKPGAEMVGVAHSSADPSMGVVISST